MRAKKCEGHIGLLLHAEEVADRDALGCCNCLTESRDRTLCDTKKKRGHQKLAPPSYLHRGGCVGRHGRQGKDCEELLHDESN